VVGENFCVGGVGFLVVFWFLFFVLLLFWVLLVLVFGCFVRGFMGFLVFFIGPFCFGFGLSFRLGLMFVRFNFRS